MLIGIVSDIHEHVENLGRALSALRNGGADTVVSLGDACQTFGEESRAAEVAALLDGAGARGVWGNHDFGFCREVCDEIRRRADEATLAVMARMQPHLVVGDCRFTHIEPWLDPKSVEDLWFFDGPPDTAAKAGRSFAAVPERVLFVGHFHRWLVMTPAGRVEWDGQSALDLKGPGRYLVVVAPVVDGWCAAYDTEAQTLFPVWCGT